MSCFACALGTRPLPLTRTDKTLGDSTTIAAKTPMPCLNGARLVEAYADFGTRIHAFDQPDPHVLILQERLEQNLEHQSEEEGVVVID